MRSIIMLFVFSLFHLWVLGQNNIQLIEYGWDTDQGFGRNTLVSVTPNGNQIDFTANTNSLSNGFHLFFVRGRNSNGIWSQTQFNIVYIQSGILSAKIVRLEYSYSQGSVLVGQYSYTLPDPSNTINLQFKGNAAQLVNGQTYLLSIQAIDEKGNRSQVYTKLFTRIISTCSTIKSGLWHEAGTWSCGRRPSLSDEVIINAGHIVTLNSETNEAQSLRYNGGKLVFTNGSKLIVNP